MRPSKYQDKMEVDAAIMEIAMLVQAGYPITRAIRMSGIARRTFYNRIGSAVRALPPPADGKPDEVMAMPQRPTRQTDDRPVRGIP